jgi:hypothetical protein
MKSKYYLCLVISFITFSLLAQEMSNSFLEKYGKDTSLEVITIGKKMLSSIISDSSIADSQLKEAINGVENILIISSKDKSLNNDYYRSAVTLITNNKNFRELLSINQEEESLLVMIKENKGIVHELILLSNRADIFNFISLKGNIKLDLIAKYSKNLDFNEWKKWKIIKN